MPCWRRALKTSISCSKTDHSLLDSVLEGLREAQTIQLRHHGNASKTTLSELPASLPTQHHLQSLPRWQQITRIVGGIGQLGLTELLHPAPVAALGQLVELDAPLTGFAAWWAAPKYLITPYEPDPDVEWESCDAKGERMARTWYGSFRDAAIADEFRRYTFRDAMSCLGVIGHISGA